MSQYVVDNETAYAGKGYSIVSPLLAFILWGGWAFHANNGYAYSDRVIYGLTQGIVSFTVTSLMIKIVTWLFRRLPRNPLRFVLPSVITVGIATAFMVFAHHLAGTPKIFHTVTPGLTVGLVFCLFTTFRLHRATLHIRTDEREEYT